MPTAPTTTQQALDHHTLATTVWLVAGFVAAALFHYGLGGGGGRFLAAAFVVALAAFVGHVIVNLLYSTGFSARELAPGLVVFAAALVAFGLAMLVWRGFAARAFLPVSAGFIALLVGVLFYMATTAGLRGAFDAFNVIRASRAGVEPSGQELE